MDFKDFIKSTEAIVVFGGLFLTLTLGKFWAIATAIAYALLNINKPFAWLTRLLNK